MIILLSPAKTFDLTTHIPTRTYSEPAFLDEAEQLMSYCKALSAEDIQTLMKISDELAQLNFVRFQDWHRPFTLKNARQACYSFNGDVYTGLNSWDFNQDELDFAQIHVRILSGLYGILKPLDLIQPYRLEMGIPLKNEHNKNLYEYWSSKIAPKLTEMINSSDHKEKTIINLASNEYFKSVDKSALTAKVIEPIFLDEGKSGYKIISFYAKKARGLMTRFIIKNRIIRSQDIEKFDLDGYQYDPEQSTETKPVFKRAKSELKK